MKSYSKAMLFIALLVSYPVESGQSPKRAKKPAPSKPAPRQTAKPAQAAKPVAKKTDQELLREQVAHFNKTKNKEVIEAFNKDKRLKDFCLKNLIPIRNWTPQDREDTKKWARKACEMIVSNSKPGEIYDNFNSIEWPLGRILDDAFSYFTGKKEVAYATDAAACIPKADDFFNKNEIMKSPRKANFVSKKSDKELLQQQIARISRYKWLDRFKAVKDFYSQNLCPIGNWTKQDQLNTGKWIKKVYSLIGSKSIDPRGETTDDIYVGGLVVGAFLNSPYYLSLTDQAKWISDAHAYGTYLAQMGNSYEPDFSNVESFIGFDSSYLD